MIRLHESDIVHFGGCYATLHLPSSTLGEGSTRTDSGWLFDDDSTLRSDTTHIVNSEPVKTVVSSTVVTFQYCYIWSQHRPIRRKNILGVRWLITRSNTKMKTWIRPTARSRVIRTPGVRACVRACVRADNLCRHDIRFLFINTMAIHTPSL